jgi:hypothetical protein
LNRKKRLFLTQIVSVLTNPALLTKSVIFYNSDPSLLPAIPDHRHSQHRPAVRIPTASTNFWLRLQCSLWRWRLRRCGITAIPFLESATYLSVSEPSSQTT